MRKTIALSLLALSLLILPGCGREPTRLTADAVPTAYMQIEIGEREYVEVTGTIEDVTLSNYNAANFASYSPGDTIPADEIIQWASIDLDTTQKDYSGNSVVTVLFVKYDADGEVGQYTPEETLGFMSLSVGDEVTVRGWLDRTDDHENEIIDYYYIRDPELVG